MERQSIEMKDPVLAPGVTYTAIAQITIQPAGLDCEAELFLGVNDTNIAATSGRVLFVSSGTPQSISFPVTMPTTYEVYNVYLDVYIEGFKLLAFQATEDVVIPGGYVGPIVWE